MGSGLTVVGPASEAQKEEQDVTVREFRVRNSRPSEGLVDAVRAVLSRRGTVTYMPSRNSMVVKDIPLGIERVEALLEHIDVEPAQIIIEAKIAELADSFQRELGIQWGARYTADEVFGQVGSLDSGFAVNLPPSEDQGGTFDLGLVVDKFSVDFQLSALEDTGEARIVSSPRVMVLDGEEAVITSGAEILVPSVSTADILLPAQGAGGKTSDVILTQKPGTFDARLELAVRPKVIDEERISMSIHTKKEEFDFATIVNDFPLKRSRTARTDLTVRSGETIVIGGIYTKAESRDERAVPLLSRIPVLGWLFKKNSRSSGQTELLIFLTPTIVKREGS
jgi:type IV pilus assembly protein PilQ